MGMFDTVYFSCPACGERIEDQSKSGSCMLRYTSLAETPADVLRGLDPEGYCPRCACAYRLVITTRVVEEVHARVERAVTVHCGGSPMVLDTVANSWRCYCGRDVRASDASSLPLDHLPCNHCGTRAGLGFDRARVWSCEQCGGYPCAIFDGGP